MDRRNFLTKTGVVVGTSIITPKWIFAQKPPVNETVEKVHLIFKTHLDVGFTDMAANVINTYFEKFIPAVLDLTELIAGHGKGDRYIWTTGSWLVYRYLEEASPENRHRMERAIERGDFVWHGLPFTTHTELMDKSLLKLALSYSEYLDKLFGFKTLAAKMTDVPGHSRAIVPIMKQAGIELLHIGVNDASAIPDVPPFFLWKSPEGSELMVMYQHSYGGTALLPGGHSAVSLNFTSDNQGPHTPKQIKDIYAQLGDQFPNAKIFASNLNSVAVELNSLRPDLPVVTKEIGDSWIHGPGSDPLLMAQFRELSRLRKEWIEFGKLTANSETDTAFGENLLCVPEHTWGMYIATADHWDIYDMPAFRSSRNLQEFRQIEASWSEKRSNIDKAITTLPPGLKDEANARLKSIIPARTDITELQVAVSKAKLFSTKYFKLGFDMKTGAINFLEHKLSGRQWAGKDQPLGLFSYQTFSPPDFERFMKQYVPRELLSQNLEWVEHSWNKPGLKNLEAKSGLYFSTLKQLFHQRRKDGEFFLSQMNVPDAGDSGCPGEIIVETFLPDSEPTVKMTMKWFNKPASRLPEACWFSFIPSIAADGKFEMDKMGQFVSPLDVVKNGNRNLHGVTVGVSYSDRQNGFQLETMDAFLVAPGSRSLLNFDNLQPDMAGGLHFCLCNNLTGTNFRMWFEDDMQFRFTFRCFPGSIATPDNKNY